MVKGLKFSVNGATTEILLLSCFDFRLPGLTYSYMKERGLEGKYDHIILAGSSLAALTNYFPSWNKTFWEHLEVAIKLHQIKKVMIMDHRDCGSYRVIFNEDFSKDKEKETQIHCKKLVELKNLILQKYSNLEIELLLLNLDGKVETIK